MILRTQVPFTANGDNFMPSQVSDPFSDAHNPGEIGRVGRDRGIPQPGGSASFASPESEQEKITYPHRIVVPLLPTLRKAGAEDFTLHITYHCDSGAIGFSKEEVRMIAEMECDIPIDCLIEEKPSRPTPVNPHS